ncbi:ISAs1 family transposase [Actinomadura formosensis]|uniref:ISAs1 family transposase n=1 Tax=Actinomadura formosensis TaxID=60706 RepID=UPI003D8CB14D
MVECATIAAAPVHKHSIVSVPLADACCDLLELLRGVSDGRSDQGRDHPVAAVLALSAAATVAGMRGYTAIAGWVDDVPAGVLADLYMQAGAAPAGPPSKTTIWRVLTDADGVAFDAAIGAWLMNHLLNCAAASAPCAEDGAEPMQVRLDGKTVRGAKSADGSQLHLLAAVAGPPGPAPVASVVVAQAQVPDAKPKETTVATSVLAQIDLNDKVVTADALHTVKATATYIHARGGHFVFPVKENRQALFDALDALPWRDTPVAHTETDHGHGRITTRTIQVLPAPPNLPFPHVNQVFLIERYVTGPDGKPISSIAQLGVASPTADQATAADLAGYVRGQWTIEVLHWLRDTTWREDNSTIRTRSGPRIMASLRKPGHRRPTPGRTYRHHRSHPLGLPQHDQALHYPRPHLTDLGTAVTPPPTRTATSATRPTWTPPARQRWTGRATSLLRGHERPACGPRACSRKAGPRTETSSSPAPCARAGCPTSAAPTADEAANMSKMSTHAGTIRAWSRPPGSP